MTKSKQNKLPAPVVDLLVAIERAAGRALGNSEVAEIALADIKEMSAQALDKMREGRR